MECFFPLFLSLAHNVTQILHIWGTFVWATERELCTCTKLITKLGKLEITWLLYWPRRRITRHVICCDAFRSVMILSMLVKQKRVTKKMTVIIVWTYRCNDPQRWLNSFRAQRASKPLPAPSFNNKTLFHSRPSFFSH